MQLVHEARYLDAPLDFDPFEEVEPSGSPQVRAPAETCDDNDNNPTEENSPLPLEDTVKILGILLDKHLTLDDHFRDLLRRSQMRQAVLARIAKQKWGLDSTILKITHDALVTSFVRYGLILVGSCLPDDLANRMDTQVINPAARRIANLPLPQELNPVIS